MSEPLETQEAASANRLQVLGHEQSPSRRKPIVELDAKGKLLIEFMVEGCRHDWITRYTRLSPTGEDPERRIPIEPGWPLTLSEAADALRIRRRYARWLASQPVFQRALAEALQAFREGHKAEALHTVVGVMRDRGEGTAADKKVQLQAAGMVLGEPDSARGGVTVNVSNNVGVQLRAGIVIRARHNTPPSPLEQEQLRPPIIETHPVTLEQRSLPAPPTKERAP